MNMIGTAQIRLDPFSIFNGLQLSERGGGGGKNLSCRLLSLFMLQHHLPPFFFG